MPAADGMIVETDTPKVHAARKGVMEFLLINHPLDCPICDQGGECQLQDLAVGYGASTSRYDEEKRVVYPKDVGPLLSMYIGPEQVLLTLDVEFDPQAADPIDRLLPRSPSFQKRTNCTPDTIAISRRCLTLGFLPCGASQ